jgi:hypothetical protein
MDPNRDSFDFYVVRLSSHTAAPVTESDPSVARSNEFFLAKSTN